MSFATKLSHIVYSDGREEDVMKQPATDAGKFSLPGVLAVKRVDGIPTAFPADSGEVAPHENMLQVGVCRCGVQIAVVIWGGVWGWAGLGCG